MFAMLAFTAVVTTATAVSCSHKSTLGMPEISCMATVGDKFEVHYGYIESAKTVSFCAVNKKHDGFVGFGPAFGTDDPEGIVVVGDAVDSTPRLKAWYVAKLRRDFTEVNAFFSDPTHEVARNARRICFTMPAAKLRGSLTTANFLWRVGTATYFVPHHEDAKSAQEWASITLNLEHSQQRNDRRYLQQVKCSKKSTLKKAEVPCMTIARKDRVEIHYGRQGDVMSLCAVNIQDEGWIGLGTTTSMADATAILGDGRSGALTERTVKLVKYDIHKDKPEDLASGPIAHTITNNKRMLCFAIHKSKLDGTPEEANFIWGVWPLDAEGSQITRFHGPMGTLTLNFDETLGGDDAKPTDSTGKAPQDTTAPQDTSACPKSTLGDKKMTCKVVSTEHNFELDYGYDKEGKTVSFCGTNTDNDGWVGVGPGKNMDGTVVILADKKTHGAYALEEFRLGKARPEFTDPKTIQNKVVDGKRMVCGTIGVKTLDEHGGITSASFVYAVGAAGEEFTSGKKHASKGKLVIDFVTGSSTASALDVPLLVLLHVACMVSAFLLMYPAGVLVAVFSGPGFSKGPQYFARHKGLMIAATLFAWIGAVLIMIHKKGQLEDMHGIVGAVVIFLCTAQPINAQFRVAKDHPLRRKWEYLHKGLGRFSVIGGFITCVLGAYLFRERQFGVKLISTILIIAVLSCGCMAISAWFVFWAMQRKAKNQGTHPKLAPKKSPSDDDGEDQKKNAKSSEKKKKAGTNKKSKVKAKKKKKDVVDKVKE
eukprot:GEMP01010310.1.p1 GENE.GEMP01010310.1~~GEMP01010310.1.p1  ORF type:complete len:764 (+),score=137.11 GEMP01010310.1:527-2818(+)